MNENPIIPPTDNDTPDLSIDDGPPMEELQSPASPMNNSVASPPSENPNRLERLGGEPAPDITPEEFARLQQSGQIHIDPRGRVRSAYNNPDDSGISLRKRRAWYF